VGKYPTRFVVITGGEPLLAPEVEELTTKLKGAGRHITIETAATIFKPLDCDLISMSPKLSHSTPWKREKGRFAKMHERRRLNFAVIQRYLDGWDYQIKFVVDQKADFREIEDLLSRLKGVDPARVLIMAQGCTRLSLREKTKWIVEFCKAYGYGFTPRLQIELFGNRRGT
jgi:7-carboxy-7-deazaguanine synthase